ncbi:hypothetical protein DN745_00050 [Bradymonas sediminis]|uniref:Uncharacterized protein n=1 Tax=Bradymonas sediminis TaxID=1548548 RepID=A0A2Z4FFZ2_9DELT|nr:hypothetical protein DN745_00050 [Bradymonas sediminis]
MAVKSSGAYQTNARIGNGVCGRFRVEISRARHVGRPRFAAQIYLIGVINKQRNVSGYDLVGFLMLFIAQLNQWFMGFGFFAGEQSGRTHATNRSLSLSAAPGGEPARLRRRPSGGRALNRYGPVSAVLLVAPPRANFGRYRFLSVGAGALGASGSFGAAEA